MWHFSSILHSNVWTYFCNCRLHAKGSQKMVMPEISCFTSLYIVFIIFWPGSIFNSMHIECIFYPPPYLILNVSSAIVYLGKYRNVLSLAYDWIFHSHFFWQICLVIFFYVYKFLTVSIVHAVSKGSYQSAFLKSEAKNHRDPSILVRNIEANANKIIAI